jgi:thymidine kinase
MFIEPAITNNKRGWIEVICGSMFSGKTEELIRRLKRVKIANQKVEIFKPSFDIRFSATEVVSHDANAFPSIAVDIAQKIFLYVNDADVVAIDEAQFFDIEIVNVCEILALRGIRVIVAGLDMDYLGKPFGPVPQLLAVADYITKLHAVCVKCGNIANISYRKIVQDEQLLLGEKDIYEPRCRNCYNEE